MAHLFVLLLLLFLAVPVFAQTTTTISFYLIGGIGSSLNPDPAVQTYNEQAAVYYKYSDDASWSFVNTYTLENSAYTQVTFDALDSTGNLSIKVVSSNTGLVPATNSQRYIFMNDNQFTIGSYSVLNYTMYLSCSSCSSSEQYNILAGFFYEDAEYTITFPSDLTELATPFFSSAVTIGDCPVTTDSSICVMITGYEGDETPLEQEKLNVSIEHLDGSVDTYMTYLLVTRATHGYSINYNQDPLSNAMTNKGFKKIIFTFLNALPVTINNDLRGVMAKFDPIYLDGSQLAVENIATSGPETANYYLIPANDLLMFSQGKYSIRYAPNMKMVNFLLRGNIGYSQDPDRDVERTWDEKVGIYFKLLGESDWMFYAVLPMGQGLANMYVNYPDEGKNLTLKLVTSNTGFIPNTPYFRFVYISDSHFLVDNNVLLTLEPFLTCTGCSALESVNRTRGILAENATYFISIPLDTADYPSTTRPVDENSIDCSDTSATSVCVHLWSDHDDPQSEYIIKVNISIVHQDESQDFYYTVLPLYQAPMTPFRMNPNTDPVTGQVTNKGMKRLIITLLNALPADFQDASKNIYFYYYHFKINGVSMVYNTDYSLTYPSCDYFDQSPSNSFNQFLMNGDYIFSLILPNNTVSFQLKGNLGSAANSGWNVYNEQVDVYYRYSGDTDWIQYGSYQLENNDYTIVQLSYVDQSQAIEMKLTTSNYIYNTGNPNVPYVYFNENEFKMNDVYILNISNYMSCTGCGSGEETSLSRGILLYEANYIFTIPASTDDLPVPTTPIGVDSIDCTDTALDTVCFLLSGAMGTGVDHERVSISVTYADDTVTTYYSYLSLSQSATTIKLAYNTDPVTGATTNKVFKSFSINFFNDFVAVTSPYDRNVYLDYSSLTINGIAVTSAERSIVTPSAADDDVKDGTLGTLNWYGVYTLSYTPNACTSTTFKSNGDRICMQLKSKSGSGASSVKITFTNANDNSTIESTYSLTSSYQSISVALNADQISAVSILPLTSDNLPVLDTQGFLLNGDVITSSDYCVADDFTIYDSFNINLS